MIAALAEGFRRARRARGLAVVVFAADLGLALLLAVPFTLALREALHERGAAATMLHGFDYPFWSHWDDTAPDWLTDFRPEILGAGFAFRNLDLLLRGTLPVGLFDPGLPGGGPDVSALVLGLGALYLVVQAVLAGGLIPALRGGGGWTVRGVLHGAGFHAGRMLRLLLLGLAVDAILFALHRPLAGWADRHAREAVSEATAMAWLLGRHALLLAALLAAGTVTGFARVITVAEGRVSAVLAWVSALGMCLRHPLRTLGMTGAVALSGAALLALWAGVDGRLAVTGYRTQAVALVLMEGLVLGRIFLRLWLLASQAAFLGQRGRG